MTPYYWARPRSHSMWTSNSQSERFRSDDFTGSGHDSFTPPPAWDAAAATKVRCTMLCKPTIAPSQERSAVRWQRRDQTQAKWLVRAVNGGQRADRERATDGDGRRAGDARAGLSDGPAVMSKAQLRRSTLRHRKFDSSGRPDRTQVCRKANRGSCLPKLTAKVECKRRPPEGSAVAECHSEARSPPHPRERVTNRPPDRPPTAPLPTRRPDVTRPPSDQPPYRPAARRPTARQLRSRPHARNPPDSRPAPARPSQDNRATRSASKPAAGRPPPHWSAHLSASPLRSSPSSATRP